MAEEFAEKTEAPTPRRREESREQGHIARSADLTAAVILLFALLMMNWFGPALISTLYRLTGDLLSARSMETTRPDSIGASSIRAVALAGAALAPLLLGGLVVAVAANMLQVGFFFSPARLAPNFGLLNPGRGLARIFERQNLVHLVTNLLKLALVGTLAWSALRERLPAIISTQDRSVGQMFALGAAVVWGVGIRVAMLLLLLALLDYAYQKYRSEMELRMSKQEIKEEMRRMEGDPRLRQRRRQIAIQMHTRRLKKEVPTADVIITNPTEFAVALKYEQGTMHAPTVVAKGQGFMARRIREIAVEHGVPILERPPLARALFRLVEVGREIPEQFYTAVAEILAYVYELNGKAKRMQAV